MCENSYICKSSPLKSMTPNSRLTRSDLFEHTILQLSIITNFAWCILKRMDILYDTPIVWNLDESNLTGSQDAAAAALFTACKIEDTLKKSKEILCAAYNMKVAPSEQLTPDDPVNLTSKCVKNAPTDFPANSI